MSKGPLARGRLTRDRDESSTRSETDKSGKILYVQSANDDRKIVEKLAEITAPIVGATRLRHSADALAATTLDWSSEDVSSLNELYVPHAVAGFA